MLEMCYPWGLTVTFGAERECCTFVCGANLHLIQKPLFENYGYGVLNWLVNRLGAAD